MRNFSTRLEQVRRFYKILDDITRQTGGLQRLKDFDGCVLPRRGVYFFFEDGEVRTTSGRGPRVTRVGTHAILTGSQTTLWGRLKMHRGALSNGGGGHRASIFRVVVGEAIANNAPELRVPTWRDRLNPPEPFRTAEHCLEVAVSSYIRNMPFVWLEADDESGPGSIRSVVERSCIALLSNYDVLPEEAIDPPSPNWLGRSVDKPEIRSSGLWNSHHVKEEPSPGFLDTLASLVG